MAAEEGGGVLEGLAREGEGGLYREEAVDGAGVAVELGGETPGVGFAFVAEGVVFGGHDERGGGAGEVGGVERRSERVAEVGSGGEIFRPATAHVGGAWAVAFGELGVRGRRADGIDHGVDE